MMTAGLSRHLCLTLALSHRISSVECASHRASVHCGETMPAGSAGIACPHSAGAWWEAHSTGLAGCNPQFKKYEYHSSPRSECQIAYYSKLLFEELNMRTTLCFQNYPVSKGKLHCNVPAFWPQAFTALHQRAGRND